MLLSTLVQPLGHVAPPPQLCTAAHLPPTWAEPARPRPPRTSVIYGRLKWASRKGSLSLTQPGTKGQSLGVQLASQNGAGPSYRESTLSITASHAPGAPPTAPRWRRGGPTLPCTVSYLCALNVPQGTPRGFTRRCGSVSAGGLPIPPQAMASGSVSAGRSHPQALPGHGPHPAENSAVRSLIGHQGSPGGAARWGATDDSGSAMSP